MQAFKFNIVIASLMLFSIHLAGQNRIASKKYDFEVNKKSIDETLKLMNSSLGINFSYKSDIIPKDQTVTIQAKQLPINEILDQLLEKTQIDYQIIENQVVLNYNPEKKIKINKYTLSGYIKDETTGETLIGATIFIPQLNSGTVTNNYGFYSITVPEGNYTIQFSFLGFQLDTMLIGITSNKSINKSLKSSNEVVQEIIVKANENPLAEVINKGEASINAKTISSIPALMGEADVIKSLQSVPGISSFGDGSTSFFVRGGNRDQNLILIDEAPIFNPSHLMGFYSTFIPEAIKDVKIYKGNIPASYGGRLSSLIDIRTRDGNMKKWEYKLNIGLVASKLMVNGPLKKDKSSLFVSHRKSHIRKLLGNTIDDNLDIYFNDFNTKFNYIINDKNRLYLSFYYGKDDFNIQNEIDGQGIQWENVASTLRWNHIFSDKLFSNTTLHASNYDYKLFTSYSDNTYWNSAIININLKNDFTYFYSAEFTSRFGLNFGAHDFNPGNISTGDIGFENALPKVSSSKANEFSAYISNNHKFNQKFSFTYGFRFSSWMNMGEAVVFKLNDFYQAIDTLVYVEGEKFHTHRNLEPRVSFKYNIYKQHILKASYNLTTQYIQLISNSISPFTSLDVWLPSGVNIKPQIANQFSVGYENKILNESFFLNLEGFYKQMRNQIDYIDHAYMLLNPLLESQLRFGTAKSYGIELLLKKDIGKFKGWISYSYSRIFNKIEDINEGKEFPAYYDRPHDFTIFMSYDFSPRFTISANWIFTSGATFTSPTSFYEYNGYTIPVYSSKNNDRLPNYHRMDVALSYRFNKKEQRFNHGIDFSIFNLYNHKNPNFINFNKQYDVFGNIAVPGNQNTNDLIITESYLYTFLPSISYYLRF